MRFRVKNVSVTYHTTNLVEYDKKYIHICHAVSSKHIKAEYESIVEHCKLKRIPRSLSLIYVTIVNKKFQRIVSMHGLDILREGHADSSSYIHV